ncbi:hypothetical protein BDP27DRAFT_1421781 [Rhodocollybia butyracea]|uniref:Uncharacterized protein n=1 Tax=Rhodocollybia butyracea TaxID=206335 RepID=A0A9P5PSM4_9AGAR|nr:hypothetical protein BDP27DRAFT_1421781 [Rhodocollybia butyracea]
MTILISLLVVMNFFICQVYCAPIQSLSEADPPMLNKLSHQALTAIIIALIICIPSVSAFIYIGYRDSHRRFNADLATSPRRTQQQREWTVPSVGRNMSLETLPSYPPPPNYTSGPEGHPAPPSAAHLQK